MAIPLVALMGRPADSVDQYSAGAMNAANIRKTEAEAGAAADGRKMQVFQQIGGALKGLEGLPPEQQAAGFDRIKTLALRTWGDNPEIASQIEPLTVQNLPDLYGMFTSYADQMKTEGQMAKDAATVDLTGAKIGLVGEQTNTARANTGLVYRKIADVGEDNARADWNTASMVGDRAQRTALYGSSVENLNANRDATTDLARKKAEANAFGQLPDGSIMQDGVAEPIPGYVPSASTGGVTVGPDGTINIQPYTGKLTEAQSKDIVYARRAAREAQKLDKIGGALTDPVSAVASGMGSVGNYLKSDEYQEAEVAARGLITALLRKETGAAITSEEWQIYGPMILPQPGDTPEVIAQKAQNRRDMVQDIQTGLGPAASLTDQPGVGKGGPPQPGMVEEGFRFKGGDPADPNNWEPAQ